MKKNPPQYKVCPKCDLFWGLEAEDDHYCPVHKTDQLETCPECQTPLEIPQAYHYIFVNKRAVADAKAKEDTLLKRTQREKARLTRENQELRKSINTSRSSLPIKPQPKEEEHQAKTIDEEFEKGARYLLNQSFQEITRLKNENQELRNTVLQLQKALNEQNTIQRQQQPASLPKCLECGKDFTSKARHQEFCSIPCRTKANNRKRAKRREENRSDELVMSPHHSKKSILQNQPNSS